MRNISENIKSSIINVFDKENTLAIIVFGSYGTDKQTNQSDIDIAWIPKNKVPITEIVVKTEALRKELEIEIDLKIVTDKYTIELKKSILEGDVIYEDKQFRDYLNDFYFDNSDVIDILEWRDMYGS